MTSDEERRNETLRRLRWRARRGLLENDLLLERFLERQGHALNEGDVHAVELLLELPDNTLFDLLFGHRQPTGALDLPAVRNMLARIGSNAMREALPAPSEFGS